MYTYTGGTWVLNASLDTLAATSVLRGTATFFDRDNDGFKESIFLRSFHNAGIIIREIAGVWSLDTQGNSLITINTTAHQSGNYMKPLYIDRDHDGSNETLIIPQNSTKRAFDALRWNGSIWVRDTSFDQSWNSLTTLSSLHTMQWIDLDANGAPETLTSFHGLINTDTSMPTFLSSSTVKNGTNVNGKQLYFDRDNDGDIDSFFSQSDVWNLNSVMAYVPANGVFVATATSNASGNTATMTYNGIGYTSVPTVTVSGGSCTTNPTATATLTVNGTISDITLTGAVGCTVAPVLTVAPPQAAGTYITNVSPSGISAWDKILIEDTVDSDATKNNITYDILQGSGAYCTTTVIPGKSGIRPNTDGYIDIAGLSVTTYPSLCIRANFYRDQEYRVSPTIERIIVQYSATEPPFILMDTIISQSAASLPDYTIHNTATISTVTPEISEINNTSRASISVIHTDLKTTLAVDKSAANSSDAVKYTYEYHNDGVNTAQSTDLRVILPTHVASVSSTVAGLTSLGRPLMCTTEGYRATAFSNSAGTIATIASGGAGYVTAPAVAVSGGLCTTLPTATAVLTGDVVTGVTLTGAVSCTVAPTLTIEASPKPYAVSCTVAADAAQGLSANTLAPGERGIVEVNTLFASGLTAGSNAIATACSTTTVLDINESNNCAPVNTLIGTLPNVTISISGSSSATIGSFVPYTITYTNNGNDPAAGVIMTDLLSSDNTYISTLQ